MKVGEWAVFTHTTMIGTVIFPQPRLVEDFNDDVVYFDTKEYPVRISRDKIITTYQTIHKARDAIEVGLAEWGAREPEITKLEIRIDLARKKRLKAVIAEMMKENTVDA